MVLEENAQEMLDEYSQPALLRELARRYTNAGNASNILKVFGSGPPAHGLSGGGAAADAEKDAARTAKKEKEAAAYASAFLEGDEL
eukprot:SAG22_NODE_7229_length_759_cov_2.256061_2_plen_86_part_00